MLNTAKKITLFLFVSLLFSGCVSMKTYRNTQSELLSLKYGRNAMTTELEQSRAESARLAQQNAELLAKLNNSKDDERIAELETALAERDRILEKIRAELTDAVGHLQGRGLSLVNKNGKIYVLMEDKLLFESGKYNLTKEGKTAIREIGTVLAKIKNVDIVIEGHTDNKGLLERKDAEIVDNWDLSCKRATEVVRVLGTTKGLPMARITASGRGQYMPIATNKTESGRAQNRRTEIALTPQLDKLIKLLK